MRIKLIVANIFALSSMLFAKSGQQLANELKLDPSSKAIKQWERIFEVAEKRKQLGIDRLSDTDKLELKKYLLDHAADSDHPTVAGK
ncbi:MAG: hypothetical protein PHE67_03195 [Campylobacterales bacterium]|nr:hypothetical protein [Campylobacterales bacterium]